MKHQPRKRFGQNFLHDPGVIDRITAAVAPGPEDRLVEIGPGQGAITMGLLRAVGRMDAVELDRDLVEPLARRCAGMGTLRIHRADALGFDFCALAVPGERLRIVGNLPYNVSTPLLFRLIGQAECIQDMHLMLQKEVVERIAAAPGSRIYGRLSVMVQTYCLAERLFLVRPGAFNPPPSVDSAFLRLTPRHHPARAPRDLSFHAALVARAFAQRRKTLRNSLRGLIAPELLLDQGIDPGQRAEELDPPAYVALADVACKSAPQPRVSTPIEE